MDDSREKYHFSSRPLMEGRDCKVLCSPQGLQSKFSLPPFHCDLKLTTFFLRAGPKSSCTTLYNLLFNPALKKKGCHILLVHSELLLLIKLESNQGTKFWKTDCSIINNIQFTSVATSSSLKLSILHYVFYVFAEHPLSDAKLMFKKMKKIMYTMVKKTFFLIIV